MFNILNWKADGGYHGGNQHAGEAQVDLSILLEMFIGLAYQGEGYCCCVQIHYRVQQLKGFLQAPTRLNNMFIFKYEDF